MHIVWVFVNKSAAATGAGEVLVYNMKACESVAYLDFGF